MVEHEFTQKLAVPLVTMYVPLFLPSCLDQPHTDYAPLTSICTVRTDTLVCPVRTIAPINTRPLAPEFPLPTLSIPQVNP